MADFDVDAMKDRFRMRAEAVKERGIPPLEGSARRRFIEQAEQDYTDFALLAAAEWEVADGELVLRVPLGGDA